MKIEDILHIELDNADEHKFGERPIRLIEESFELQENDVRRISSFLSTLIESLEAQNKHMEQWVGIVYHENTVLSNEFEITTCKQILDNIEQL